MDPDYGARVVAHGRLAADDPKQIEEIKRNLARDSSVWDMASLFAVQAVIDPAETRAWLIRMFDVHRRRLKGGIGAHLMGNWPSTF
jgi:acetyl-CoA carboxylase carboxyltransferase component